MSLKSPTANIPQAVNLNHPFGAPTPLSLQESPDAIHGIDKHTPRQLSRLINAVIFDVDACSGVRVGEGVRVDEAVAMVEDGGVVDGAESGDEGLVADGLGDGGGSGVGEEYEGDRGVRYVIRRWSWSVAETF